MALPSPAPGLVISYSYLWHCPRGGRNGRPQGSPCAIVLTAADEEGDLRVYVVPVTHSAPSDDPHAVELPPSVKRRLGLDDAPSWIVTNELNRFVWPGYDLRPVARSKPDTLAWGFLPENVFSAVKRRIAAHQRTGRLKLNGRE